MPKPKKSVASSLLSQARLISAEDDRPEQSPVATLPLTRLKYGSDSADGQALQARFPTADGDYQILDISYLLTLPNLERPFASAFLWKGATLAHDTRNSFSLDLRRGFCAYLQESQQSEVGLNDIDEVLVAGFIKCLNQTTASGTSLSKGTRGQRLGALRLILNELALHEEWSQLAIQARAAIPANAWPGRSKSHKPRVRLSAEELQRIILAAEQEALATSSAWESTHKLLQDGAKAIRGRGLDYSDRAVCLAALHITAPGILNLQTLQDQDPELLSACGQWHDPKALLRQLYVSGRDLVPLALLIAVATAFNPDTVLSLDRAGIQKGERFGLPTLRISGRKGRSSEDPAVLLDGSPADGFNLDRAIDALNRATSRIRRFVRRPSHRDRLFLFAPRTSSEPARSYGHAQHGPSCDSNWKYNFRLFMNDHDLPRFSLGQIRATILDEAQLQTGDLLTAQAIGKHKNPQTTWKHYTSDGVKRRYRSSIGLILLLRERWHSSGGVIDPRHRPLSDDVGAATPGFLCLDPFDSPRPNQRQGRLCTAYGECPSCPLAGADIGNSTNVAMFMALERAIVHSRSQVSPRVWAERGKPVLDDLVSLLVLIPPATIEEASTYFIQLPPVG